MVDYSESILCELWGKIFGQDGDVEEVYHGITVDAVPDESGGTGLADDDRAASLGPLVRKLLLHSVIVDAGLHRHDKVVFHACI